MALTSTSVAVANVIGERIAAARRALGWTQMDLSFRSGLSASSIHTWEAGRVTPNAASRILLSATLGVDVADLFAEDGAND